MLKLLRPRSYNGLLASLVILIIVHSLQQFEAEVEYVIQASATGQIALSGFAPAPKQLPHTPFWVRLKLGEEARALALPVGATGAVAIYTDTGKQTHIIRRVMIRMEAIKNYVVPF